LEFEGLEDPFSCKNIKCKKIRKARINGKRKCKVKNRFRVGALTEKPPHSQFTMLVPRYGIAERRFVITVAPQKDI